MKTNKKDTEFILPLSSLGGRDNIVKVNNCATRLRLEVVNADKVDVKEIEKYYPSVLKISPTEVHIVGTNANLIAESLEKLLSSNSDSLNNLLDLIPLLGGRDNIVKVNNCATRLRLEVVNADKVDVKEIEKYYPSVLKISPTEVHIVVGTKASSLAESLDKALSSNESSPNNLLDIISLVGGKENIVKVNNCATRLRLEVVNADKINEEKYYPVVQKISPTEVHIIVGTKAFELADELKKLLDK
ncbi:PTS transporter subunit EIIB [uncultured Brachyspira sp.]|uniref:PTS transporter subunit EIIB n=1 Tax=uncultured Brachyspira sp. TaxID=221953 RepID=UPI0026194C0A|nr:PTS transporter subunit EIIB [uncultured Brachyspira sp.]